MLEPVKCLAFSCSPDKRLKSFFPSLLITCNPHRPPGAVRRIAAEGGLAGGREGGGAACEEGGVRQHISAFPNSIEEEGILKIVASCGRSAESMVAQEAPLFLDDDLAPEGGAEDDPGREEGGAVGEMPDF